MASLTFLFWWPKEQAETPATKSKVNVLGIKVEINENEKLEFLGFFCIAVQPK